MVRVYEALGLGEAELKAWFDSGQKAYDRVINNHQMIRKYPANEYFGGELTEVALHPVFTSVLGDAGAYLKRIKKYPPVVGATFKDMNDGRDVVEELKRLVSGLAESSVAIPRMAPGGDEGRAAYGLVVKCRWLYKDRTANPRQCQQIRPPVNTRGHSLNC